MMSTSTLAYLDKAARRGAKGSVGLSYSDCGCDVCYRRITVPTLDEVVRFPKEPT